MKTKMYDPYKILDPTHDKVPAPIMSRTNSGRFNGRSILSAMGDNDFPIESKYWEQYARGAWIRLGRLTGKDYLGLPDAILPPDVTGEFSWRMICEMVEAACAAAEDHKSVDEIIRAAHKYLAGKQSEILMLKYKQEHGETAPITVQAQSDLLSAWFESNWELIPEVEL